tara:strand:- start:55 stop:858 length:804 start_codon:yes stop_codon:yes gene_type:complete
MACDPIMISDSSLSFAWAKAFREVMRHPIRRCPQLFVSIDNPSFGLPSEDSAIRTALDDTLKKNDCISCDVSAMTIFPHKLWQRHHSSPCDEFSKVCTSRLLPRMKALDQRNRRGTYFERLMAYKGVRNGKECEINQLDEVIQRLNGKKHFRATGLQMTCFNPALDHSPQPRLGFPCLQHVGVTFEGKTEIVVTGYYPSQHIFSRAYGNYLGLAHLGSFLCDQTGLNLSRIVCIATHPLLGCSAKMPLKGLMMKIENRLEEREYDGE